MGKDTIKVYGAGGKKLGEIRAWTGFGDYLKKERVDIDGLGFLKWEDPKFNDDKNIIINLAWRQVLASFNDLADGNMPSICVACGEKSINTVKPSLLWRRKDRFVGVTCTNPKCKMYNVLIPWQMFCAEKEDLPWNRID